MVSDQNFIVLPWYLRRDVRLAAARDLERRNGPRGPHTSVHQRQAFTAHGAFRAFEKESVSGAASGRFVRGL